MKSKKIIGIIILSIAALIVVLIACRHKHTWSEATCTTPKMCECGEVEGEALGHIWTDADCETAKTCSVCKEIQGEPLGHNWIDATYNAPKTCSICNQTEGEPLPKQVIVKNEKGYSCTNEMLTAVESALKSKGIDDIWTGTIIGDYYNATNGNSTKVDETLLNNLVDGLHKYIEAQEQAQQAQREEKINNQENSNDWVTPEKEDSGNPMSFSL